MRAIDADALIEVFEKLKSNPNNCLQDIVFLDGAMSVINAAPTIEAASVEHAHWIPVCNTWTHDEHEYGATVYADVSELSQEVDSIIEYNVLDYAGDTLNEKWDNMRTGFLTWQNKHILIPAPRSGYPGCIQVGNDWRWKISAPLVFDDSCNCSQIEIHGELYAVGAVDQVLLFDDENKPENIDFTNGIQIRGNRFDGHTIGCAIEVRAGARINFFGQVIVNDCDYGIIIGGENQSAPSEAYFDRVQIGFFDTNAIYVYGGEHAANIFANHIETACAQKPNLNCVVLSNKISSARISELIYGTDVSKNGYTTHDANSVLYCDAPTSDNHNIIVNYVYAVNAARVVHLDGSSAGSLYDVHLGMIGGADIASGCTALYARNCEGLIVESVKPNNLIDVANCFYSRIGKQAVNASDSLDRFTGFASAVNIDGTTGINSVPAISYKNIGTITIVKNAYGKRVYINDGEANIQIDGQMFVPMVTELPAADWTLRGKMYRVNNDSGTDVIAVCIRKDGSKYVWHDLVSGADVT